MLNTSLFSKLITVPSLGNLLGDVFLHILGLISTTSNSSYDDKIIMIDVILHLLEDNSRGLLNNTLQLLEFARGVLTSEDEKMITLAMSLIYAVISSETLTPNVRPELNSIIDSLQILSKHDSIVLSNAAKELRALINACSIMNLTDSIGRMSSEDDTLDSLLLELRHKLLPVRAHAMSQIRNLIDKKDSRVSVRLEAVFSSIMPQLTHEDSFLYLNAVRVLSALVSNYPHIYLDRVIKYYNDPINPPEFRLRIAEVILQTINLFNQIFPVYSDIYIYGILKALSDSEPRMLASALSLISVIANEQPLALTRYIYTILESVKNILVFEKDKEVRRGSAAVLSNLVTYIEKRALTSENALILRQIYTVLKRLSQDDEDEVVRATSASFILYMRESIF